jgi:hypothetical protein
MVEAWPEPFGQLVGQFHLPFILINFPIKQFLLSPFQISLTEQSNLGL